MKASSPILLDRSWIARLGFEGDRIPRQVSAILAESELVGVESGGASALEVRLAAVDCLKGKLYRIKPSDMPTLAEESRHALRARLKELSQTQGVMEALRSYRAASGRMSDSDEAVLGYAFRLLILSAALQARLLVWESRYRILRSVLKESGVSFHESEGERLLQLVSEPTFFPLGDGDGAQKRQICVLAVLAEEESADDEKPSERTHLERSVIPGRDVFICHAGEDKKTVVRPLVEALAKGGITSWLDEAEVLWGDSITAKVNEGIRSSRFVVVVLSPAFLGKNWPERELNAVLNIETSTGQVKVLPILVGTAAERASILQRYPLLNDKACLVWDGTGENVLKALRRRLEPIQ